MAPVPKFETQLPQAKHYILSFPRPNVALVKLNRPKDLNCINMEGHTELDAIWSWMDAEPNLTCGIITGSGRAFSAGADLKGRPVHTIHILALHGTPLLIGFVEWNQTNTSGTPHRILASGFAGLSRRTGRKPVRYSWTLGRMPCQTSLIPLIAL